MFSFFKKRHFFTPEQNDHIVQSIKEAEKHTSGEVRVFIESHCRFMDPLDRAKEIFEQLQMHATTYRNAVLLYVALKDRQLAVYADQGIHEKTGEEQWQMAVNTMIHHFNKENYSVGISKCILEIGEALQEHFPFDPTTNKNELPDEIIFGK